MALVTDTELPFPDVLAPGFRDEQHELTGAVQEQSWVVMTPFGPGPGPSSPPRPPAGPGRPERDRSVTVTRLPTRVHILPIEVSRRWRRCEPRTDDGFIRP